MRVRENGVMMWWVDEHGETRHCLAYVRTLQMVVAKAKIPQKFPAKSPTLTQQFLQMKKTGPAVLATSPVSNRMAVRPMGVFLVQGVGGFGIRGEWIGEGTSFSSQLWPYPVTERILSVADEKSPYTRFCWLGITAVRCLVAQVFV